VIDFNGVVEVVDFPEEIVSASIRVQLLTLSFLVGYLLSQNSYLALMLLMIMQNLLLQLR
jgi:hypothetical protein